MNPTLTRWRDGLRGICSYEFLRSVTTLFTSTILFFVHTFWWLILLDVGRVILMVRHAHVARVNEPAGFITFDGPLAILPYLQIGIGIAAYAFIIMCAYRLIRGPKMGFVIGALRYIALVGIAAWTVSLLGTLVMVLLSRAGLAFGPSMPMWHMYALYAFGIAFGFGMFFAPFYFLDPRGGLSDLYHSFRNSLVLVWQNLPAIVVATMFAGAFTFGITALLNYVVPHVAGLLAMHYGSFELGVLTQQSEQALKVLGTIVMTPTDLAAVAGGQVSKLAIGLYMAKSYVGFFARQVVVAVTLVMYELFRNGLKSAEVWADIKIERYTIR